jgi:TonB dependent receptor
MEFSSSKYARPLTYLAILWLCALPLFCQSTNGELRLKVTDPSGLGVKSKVELVSQANEYKNTLNTDDGGALIAKRLPFGLYRVQIEGPGFAPVSQPMEIRSAVPVHLVVKLSITPVSTSVNVTDSDTLLDPYRTGSENEIGTQAIAQRTTSLPGRSLQDLVNAEPGWLYEGNAVLHPRGSEYQTQFVVDGIPLTDDRSPSFGPEIEADDANSLNIYTAGIPAEYGRKMGGVIELNTLRDRQAGFHGEAVLSGGGFDTAGAFARGQYSWGANTFAASADGSMTSHYLNPVVPENFTNNGTTGDFSLSYEREITQNDRLNVSLRHELSRYQIPNEQIQQSAGQRQDGDNFETMGIVSYQHIFSPDVVGNLRGMVRDNSDDLTSNPLSTPVIAFLRGDFKEGYFKGSISVHHGRHDWKAGVESDAMFLRENFSDAITDPDQFDEGTPATFSFLGNRPDLEQSAFVEDRIRLGKWTISGGLRWDHYQLIVNQNAISPRVSVARYFRSANLVVHASYDRVFQTPSSENILLSSSPTVVSLNPSILRLPVEPSHGDYYEIGLTKGILGKFRFDANYYRRYVNNFADDDQILNTAVSFPIAFDKAVIYGAEAKLELPIWGRFSGVLSYSYMLGNTWFPVTGGLFLGNDALSATTQLSGHFPNSQDQRNTLRLRFHYQLNPRIWFAAAGQYGSGLPFEFQGTPADALAQYGPDVVNRVDFEDGRVKPSLSVDTSFGADLVKRERLTTSLQFDVQNLTNRLNVIDFGGLFSGNAIAPPRSYFLRLTTNF